MLAVGGRKNTSSREGQLRGAVGLGGELVRA